MKLSKIQIGGNSFKKLSTCFYENRIFLRKSFDLRSRIEILASEGVYLDENCGTNPSRYLPGPKTPIQN